MQSTVRAGPAHWREPTDEELMERVAMGELTAFETLYDRYIRRLNAWLVHTLGHTQAEDAIQDVFVQVWCKADQFDAQRGTFATWFWSVARHQVVNELRRRGQREQSRAALELDALLAEPPLNMDEQAVRRQEWRGLRRALVELPAEQRLALILAYFARMSHSHIASSLGWPLGTVKKRIRIGLQRLRVGLRWQRDELDAVR